jgi:hypothetical protein
MKMIPKKQMPSHMPAPRPAVAVLSSEELAQRSTYGEFKSADIKIDRRADVWLALRKLSRTA